MPLFYARYNPFNQNKSGRAPLQILKDSLLVICKLQSKDSNRFTPLEKKIANFNLIRRCNSLTGLIDSHKKFVMGFTITEVIVSTLIIAVLAAGLFGAFSGSERLLSRARHKMQAYNFAMEAIDKLRSNYRYGDSAMDITPPIHTDSDIGGGIIQGEMAGLSTTLNYDVVESQPNGYKEVTIRVNWNENIF